MTLSPMGHDRILISSFKYQDAIQSDSGGKVNILAGYSIGHFEKRSPYEHVSNSEWSLRHSCLNLHTQNHCEW